MEAWMTPEVLCKLWFWEREFMMLPVLTPSRYRKAPISSEHSALKDQWIVTHVVIEISQIHVIASTFSPLVLGTEPGALCVQEKYSPTEFSL